MKTDLFDWLVARICLKDVLRYATMKHGAPSVTIHGQ